MTYSIAAVIPCYRHASSIEKVITGLKEKGLSVIITDDGNSGEDALILGALAQKYRDIILIHHDKNRGKGAAVISGIKKAEALNFSHVLQIDADGQHDLHDLDTILRLSKEHPAAVISGAPLYDEQAPKARVIGRKITNFFVHLECLSDEIEDAMIGFRCYPVDKALLAISHMPKDPNMTFDIEILVRLSWLSVRMVFFKTKIAYPKNGISNFRGSDNFKISLMHTKLCMLMLIKLPYLLYKKMCHGKN